MDLKSEIRNVPRLIGLLLQFLSLFKEYKRERNKPLTPSLGEPPVFLHEDEVGRRGHLSDSGGDRNG